ncbi:jg14123 [Pararge aegeria aegeria]|uniref:Jg14123 protein n=1 Tax=Pararge aegeria aegeria TaxID=348720 RepID=A0A8S4RYD0_9NEOP|nr:jg14123 [Pararge aegeria aegeria]
MKQHRLGPTLGSVIEDRGGLCSDPWIRFPITDIVQRAAALKWNWVGHIRRRENGRWSRVILDWQPRTGHRSIGRPPARWRDDIVKAVGKNWMQLTSNRPRWRANEKALVQQWTEIG